MSKREGQGWGQETSMELSIISVNWNSVNYLRECISSIYEHTRGITFEIIVVDNASPEGGVDALKQQFPDIVLIKSNENLGFAGANNLGFRQSSGKHILFLNPDTKLVNPAINVMLHRLESLPDAGIVGCKLLNGDLSVQTSSIMRFPRILNQVLQAEYLRLRWPDFPLWAIGPLFSSNQTPVKVEIISGACMMIRREVFERAGMFSEEYFMYAEDMDLCCKVTRAGFANYYVGEGTIVHYAGASSPREWRLIMKMRAELRLCAKFRGHLYALLFRSVLALNAAIRLFVVTLWSGFSRVVRKKEVSNAASVKYRAVLKALLTSSGGDHDPLATQKSASQCGISLP
ncbi:MAG: glycosyltransferase family 2 protein [Acidobacteriia bacterium]|nr:glycosyltransferase family 2 protein [Terriglobia bacterium]